MRVTPAVASTPAALFTSGPAAAAPAMTAASTRTPLPTPSSGGRPAPQSPSSPTTAAAAAAAACSASSAVHTCFYFTVFFSNNAPIFHSNRIPAKLLGLPSTDATAAAAASSAASSTGAAASTRPTANGPCRHGSSSGAAAGEVEFPSSSAHDGASSSPCASCQQRHWQALFADSTDTRAGGAASPSASSPPPLEGFTVGDFRSETAALDEVPQQTLQTVAFPTTFGSCTGSSGGGGGGGACPLPIRTLATRRRRASSAAAETLTKTQGEEGQGQAGAGMVEAVEASAVALSVPPAVVVGGGCKAKGGDEATSHEGSTSEGPNPKTCIPSRSSGDGIRCNAASSLHKHHQQHHHQQQHSCPDQHGSHTTSSASTSQSRHPYHLQQGIATHSPNTLPLTTTIGIDATSSTAVTTPTGETLTSAAAVPARFQPTFPAVRWVENEEEAERQQHQQRRREDPSAKAAHAGAGDGPQATGTSAAGTGAAEATRVTSATAADGPPEKREGVPVRARRPQRRGTTAAAAPADVVSPARSAAATGAAPLRRPRPSAAVAVSTTNAASKASASPLTPPATAAFGPSPPAAPTPAPSGTATKLQAQSPVSSAGVTGASATSATPAAALPPAETVAVDVTPTAVVHEGPPWNMRVEEVRSAKGELRCYRLILAVSFAALITTHTGVLHSMQTRNAATALVLTCPPSGGHYRFLLHHVDVLRSVLNRTTEFGIRTVQRFFGLLFSPTQRPSGTQQQVLKAITSRLEMHSEACETYRAVKAELASALGVLWPLPLLSPATSAWVTPILMHASTASARTRVGGAKGRRGGFGGAGGNTFTATVSDARHGGSSSTGGDRRARSGASMALRWLGAGGASGISSSSSSNSGGAGALKGSAAAAATPLSELLCDATAGLCEYSEGFASAFVCGLLSLAEEIEGRWRSRLHARTADKDDAAAAALSVSQVGSPTTTTTTTAPAAAGLASTASTRELSRALPSFNGVDAAAPEWLSPYGAYFDTMTTDANPIDEHASGANACGGECAGGWIRLTRPPKPTRAGTTAAATELRTSASGADEDDDDDVDACLRTHVSASTVSSMTPVLSPLTIDVDARSPAARLLRGRTLTSPFASTTTSGAAAHRCGGEAPRPSVAAASTFNGSGTCVANASWGASTAAAPLTPTTAQLYTISAETSVTSHATTATALHASSGGGTTGGGAAPVTNASRLSRLPASRAAAAAAGGPARPSTAAAPRQHQQSQQQSTSQRPRNTNGSAANAKEDAFALHRGRLGRVVIFTQDVTLAHRLMLVAAFLWRDSSESDASGVGGALNASARAAGRGSSISGGGGGSGAFRCEDAQRMYETAVAAAVSSADFANVPIQWVAEEFSETRLSALCSRFSPENTLLVVVPRQLQCRRVRLRKHVAGTTVLVEQQAGREARIRSPAFPFQCTVTKQTVLLPDPTVMTLLREARSLHEASRGTIDFAEVFQRMVRWLYWQSASALLKARDTQVSAAPASALAAAVAAAGTGEQGGSASGLSRYGSADQLWPSRSVSAAGSRATTPTLVTPVALLHEFPRVQARATAGATSSVESASPCSPAVPLSQSWPLDSAEDSLLPGSRGGASAAWAYTVSAGAISNPTPTGSSGGTNSGGGFHGAAGCAATPQHTTSTLLVSHGLLQPPSAFVTASPTAPTTPQKSASLRFLSWFKSSPTSVHAGSGGGGSAAASHPHPVLSPTTLRQWSAADGGQLPRLLAEEEA